MPLSQHLQQKFPEARSCRPHLSYLDRAIRKDFAGVLTHGWTSTGGKVKSALSESGAKVERGVECGGMQMWMFVLWSVVAGCGSVEEAVVCEKVEEEELEWSCEAEPQEVGVPGEVF